MSITRIRAGTHHLNQADQTCMVNTHIQVGTMEVWERGWEKAGMGEKGRGESGAWELGSGERGMEKSESGRNVRKSETEAMWEERREGNCKQKSESGKEGMEKPEGGNRERWEGRVENGVKSWESVELGLIQWF